MILLRLCTKYNELTQKGGVCTQVLFCSLTGEQRDLYRAYLSSEEVQDILNVRFSVLIHIHSNMGMMPFP